MKTKLYIISLLLVTVSAYAQQNAQYNQYIFNELVINPAYAGSKELWNINGIYSTQWMGLNGAPTTQSISVDGAMSEKIGLGVHLINDNLGAQSQQSIFGSYAYRIKLSNSFKLSLGIAAGASYYALDGTKLIVETQTDPAISNQIQTKLRFDSKTGLFLYSDRFYAGLSVSELLSDVFKSEDLLVAKQSRHYYLTSGYVFDLSDKFKLKPSFLIKEDFKAPTNIDLNAFLLYNDRLWVGTSVRTGAKIFRNNKIDNTLSYKDAITFMADYNISDRFRIGYAYTLTLSILKNYPGHEFSLGYYFPEQQNSKMKNVRYF